MATNMEELSSNKNLNDYLDNQYIKFYLTPNGVEKIKNPDELTSESISKCASLMSAPRRVT